jgi:hypothetical protein
LSTEQYDKALKEYEKFNAYQLRRKEQPLELGELLFFFFMPFGQSRSMFGGEDYIENETERYRKYGFDKKYSQIKKIRIMGIVFYALLPFLLFAVRALIF